MYSYNWLFASLTTTAATPVTPATPQSPPLCTLNIEILDCPSFVQGESYRSCAHLYTHVHEQMLRYVDEGTPFLCTCVYMCVLCIYVRIVCEMFIID